MKELRLEATFSRGEVLPLLNEGLVYCFKRNFTKLVYTFGGVGQVDCHSEQSPTRVIVKVKWANGKVHTTYAFQGYCLSRIGDFVQFEIVPGTIIMS